MAAKNRDNEAISYLRRRAIRFEHLAQHADNLGVADELMDLADLFRSEAARIETADRCAAGHKA
jgi:hypothetical protein